MDRVAGYRSRWGLDKSQSSPDALGNASAPSFSRQGRAGEFDDGHLDRRGDGSAAAPVLPPEVQLARSRSSPQREPAEQLNPLIDFNSPNTTKPKTPTTVAPPLLPPPPPPPPHHPPQTRSKSDPHLGDVELRKVCSDESRSKSDLTAMMRAGSSAGPAEGGDTLAPARQERFRASSSAY